MDPSVANAAVVAGAVVGVVTGDVGTRPSGADGVAIGPSGHPTLRVRWVSPVQS